MGGSIVTADPAAEWPACCIALDAELIVATKAGQRRTRARDFFKGVYATDLHPDEILTGIQGIFTAPAPNAGGPGEGDEGPH